MRVLVSVDMEGVAGIAAPEDVLPGNVEYERNRRFMTDEANAAVRGILAVDPGAAILVADGHARFRNLIPDRLMAGCTLVRGAPRRQSMMAGISTDIDLVCFIGYHGSAGKSESVLAHTMSGAALGRVRCNGQELGELGLNAALASHYGAVPILATGDDSLVREAEAAVPGIVAVGVKRALGNRATEGLHPEDACARIQSGAKLAIERWQKVRARRFDGPVDLEVEVLRPHMTEYAVMIPGVELRGRLTLGFNAADFPTAYDLIEVFIVLAAAT